VQQQHRLADRFKSAVKSVSENAVMQSYCALMSPAIPWRNQLSITACDGTAPGRL